VLRQALKLGLNGIGLDRKTGEPDRHVQRQIMLRALSISTVLDAGANEGQYGTRLRRWGGHYAGQIISFEPVNEAFARLRTTSAGDAQWSIYPWALSDRTGDDVIHTPLGHSDLSSLGAMTSAGRQMAQDAQVIEQQIEVKRLDDVINQVVNRGSRLALKLDVQGHERQLLDGAERTLERVLMIECEMPLVAMYESAESFSELLRHITGAGFQPVGMWSNYVVPDTGYAADADVLFARTA
jgi:FkbM family methyltransferase